MASQARLNALPIKPIAPSCLWVKRGTAAVGHAPSARDDPLYACARFSAPAADAFSGKNWPHLTGEKDRRRAGAHGSNMAAHERPRTTKLYDRTDDAITLDEVEQMTI